MVKYFWTCSNVQSYEVKNFFSCSKNIERGQNIFGLADGIGIWLVAIPSTNMFAVLIHFYYRSYEKKYIYLLHCLVKFGNWPLWHKHWNGSLMSRIWLAGQIQWLELLLSGILFPGHTHWSGLLVSRKRSPGHIQWLELLLSGTLFPGHTHCSGLLEFRKRSPGHIQWLELVMSGTLFPEHTHWSGLLVSRTRSPGQKHLSGWLGLGTWLPGQPGHRSQVFLHFFHIFHFLHLFFFFHFSHFLGFFLSLHLPRLKVTFFSEKQSKNFQLSIPFTEYSSQNSKFFVFCQRFRLWEEIKFK